ncbi:hypothetical protein L2E82_10761 [Cichorium intybus]|uniref:Uncharacterized protein n=1 Tax=Cichorium intybus TaxID=13427 RepID=A0ACB9GC23_CICIN|nr:hypothetical protein L2E82_10761 [Cichorium intybus]
MLMSNLKSQTGKSTTISDNAKGMEIDRFKHKNQYSTIDIETDVSLIYVCWCRSCSIINELEGIEFMYVAAFIYSTMESIAITNWREFVYKINPTCSDFGGNFG